MNDLEYIERYAAEYAELDCKLDEARHDGNSAGAVKCSDQMEILEQKIVEEVMWQLGYRKEREGNCWVKDEPERSL